MRMLVTKVNHATLKVDDELISKIGPGYVIYFGVGQGDTLEMASKCARKVASLRVYQDEEDRMNLKLDKDLHQILVVSQFTLYGDVSNNNRPSFTKALNSELSLPIYEHFVSELRNKGYSVETGVFGAHMIINAEYVGPLNLLYEL